MIISKRITGSVLSVLIPLCLCACSCPYRLFEAANKPIAVDSETLHDPDLSVSDTADSMPMIRFNEYEWGEGFFRILTEKTADINTSGTDYVYNENLGSFSKELVFSEEYAGHLFRCYYDFDQDDRLASVMLSLHQKLSPVETVTLYCELIDSFISNYGHWDTSEDLLDGNNGESLPDYADAVAVGRKKSTATWYDTAGTQLLTKCQLNSATGQIDLILIFSTSEHAL